MIPPPVFPDIAHVANGCYLSAVVYLAKFTAAFPAERGEPAPFVLPNGDGVNRAHTLAVISWRGEWWVRDEYFGVVALGCSTARPWDPRWAQQRADAGFRLVADRLRRQGGEVRRETAPTARNLTPAWRWAELSAARRLLPFPAEIYELRSGPRSIPFLYFRTGGDGFAVYDPAIGTAAATAHVQDGSVRVTAVAERMGYAPDRASSGQSLLAVLIPAAERRAGPVEAGALAFDGPGRLAALDRGPPARKAAG
jgi:hypothetical protein